MLRRVWSAGIDPGGRARTPRRVKGSYKALSTASEDVGVAPALLSGCRRAGEQSRLQPGSPPGLNETSETCGKQCPGRLAFFAEMPLELLGKIRCSGLPNDWKLRRLNLLGTPWVFPGNTHGATWLPPPKGFPSGFIEASARPTQTTAPQQIEGSSALGKQLCALPSPVRRDGLLRRWPPTI